MYWSLLFAYNKFNCSCLTHASVPMSQYDNENLVAVILKFNAWSHTWIDFSGNERIEVLKEWTFGTLPTLKAATSYVSTNSAMSS